MKRTQPAALAPASVASTQLVPRAIETQRPSLLDDERAGRVVLPADHPAWRRDSVSLSARARALLAKLKPFAIRVLTFWDHRSTSIPLDELILEVDASGSYQAR